jgi:hypothetical protein
LANASTADAGRGDDGGGTLPGVATVFVVDDEPILRDVVVRYLEREGLRDEASQPTAKPPKP